MHRSIFPLALLSVFAVISAMAADGPVGGSLKLTERSRKPVDEAGKVLEVIEKPVEWAPSETALIICDMWDAHWCKSATTRTGQIAPRIDKLAKTLRAQGSLIIHAPSDTMKFYEGTPQRLLAKNAPAAQIPSPPNRRGGPALPIDDTDNGCDDEPQCTIP